MICIKTISFLLAAIFWLTTPAWPLTPMSSKELDRVTARSGVNLTLDDFTMYQYFDKISFVDSDGGDNSHNPFGSPLIADSGPAQISLQGVKLDVLRINALAPNAQVGEIQARFDLSQSDIISDFTASPLTIDLVDELPVLSIGYNYMLSAKFGGLLGLPDPSGENYNKTGIVIGLPTINIYADEFSIQAITATSLNRSALNSGSSYGGLSLQGINIALLSGLVEISPHQYSGIDLALDDIVLYTHLDQLRYTDNDGTRVNSYNDGPTSLAFSDITIDSLKINALTHTDFDLGDIFDLSNVHVHSPGHYDAHLDDLDNYKMIILLGDKLSSFHGQPLLINVSRELPDTSKIMLANGGSGCVGGSFIALGTLELYMEKFSIDKIKVEDSTHQAINDGASFFGLEDRGSNLTTLNGAIEISTH